MRQRAFVLTTDSRHNLPIYPNLARTMTPAAINQLWVADITYIRLRTEFIYLAVVLDAFSRRVIGWALGRTLEAELAVVALRCTVRLYGDAAGASRSTAGQSDYEIIRQFFRTEPDFRVTYHYKSSNPLVRDRVNAVNSMLHNNERERRLLVNPCCKQLIRDLERVSWKADSNENLLPQFDKTDPGLTHVSDALGYLIDSEFALRQMGGPKSSVLF